tara:strand:- start:343 stop:660 length:318 start_codon:yes stop_codon:yes gene_type:complete
MKKRSTFKLRSGNKPAFKLMGKEKDEKNKDDSKEFKIGNTTFVGPHTEKELADTKKLDRRFRGGPRGKKMFTSEEYRNFKKVAGRDAYVGVRPFYTSDVPGYELD